MTNQEATSKAIKDIKTALAIKILNKAIEANKKDCAR